MQAKNIFTARARDHPLSEEDREVEEVLSHVDKPLLVIKSFFPLDFFPDILNINPIEVVWIHKMFFYSSYEMSIPISDIGDISLTRGPFFATLKILPTSFIKDGPITMEWLPGEEAIKAHDLLQGLVTLKKQKIDISKISSGPRDVEEIIKIGKPHEDG